MIRFACPHCGVTAKAKETAQGKTLICPSCKNKVVVPVKALPLAKVAAPSAEPAPAAIPVVATLPAVPLEDAEAPVVDVPEHSKLGRIATVIGTAFAITLVISIVYLIAGYAMAGNRNFEWAFSVERRIGTLVVRLSLIGLGVGLVLGGLSWVFPAKNRWNSKAGVIINGSGFAFYLLVKVVEQTMIGW